MSRYIRFYAMVQHDPNRLAREFFFAHAFQRHPTNVLLSRLSAPPPRGTSAKQRLRVEEGLCRMDARPSGGADYVGVLREGILCLEDLLFLPPPDLKRPDSVVLELWLAFLGRWQKAASWFGHHGPSGALFANMDIPEVHAALHHERQAQETLGGLASTYYSLAKCWTGPVAVRFLHRAFDAVNRSLNPIAGHSRRGQIGAYSVRGRILLALCRPRDAWRDFERSVRLDEELGNSDASVARHRSGLGLALAHIPSEQRAGEAELLDAVKACRHAGHGGFYISGELSVARYFASRGVPDAAADALTRALDWLERPEYRFAFRSHRAEALRLAPALGVAFPKERSPEVRDELLEELLVEIRDCWQYGARQAGLYALFALALERSARVIAERVAADPSVGIAEQDGLAALADKLCSAGKIDEATKWKLKDLARLRNELAHARMDQLRHRPAETFKHAYEWLLYLSQERFL